MDTNNDDGCDDARNVVPTDLADEAAGIPTKTTGNNTNNRKEGNRCNDDGGKQEQVINSNSSNSTSTSHYLQSVTTDLTSADGNKNDKNESKSPPIPRKDKHQSSSSPEQRTNNATTWTAASNTTTHAATTTATTPTKPPQAERTMKQQLHSNHKSSSTTVTDPDPAATTILPVRDNNILPNLAPRDSAATLVGVAPLQSPAASESLGTASTMLQQNHPQQQPQRPLQPPISQISAMQQQPFMPHQRALSAAAHLQQTQQQQQQQQAIIARQQHLVSSPRAGPMQSPPQMMVPNMHQHGPASFASYYSPSAMSPATMYQSAVNPYSYSPYHHSMFPQRVPNYPQQVLPHHPPISTSAAAVASVPTGTVFTTATTLTSSTNMKHQDVVDIQSTPKNRSMEEMVKSPETIHSIHGGANGDHDLNHPSLQTQGNQTYLKSPRQKKTNTPPKSQKNKKRKKEADLSKVRKKKKQKLKQVPYTATKATTRSPLPNKNSLPSKQKRKAHLDILPPPVEEDPVPAYVNPAGVYTDALRQKDQKDSDESSRVPYKPKIIGSYMDRIQQGEYEASVFCSCHNKKAPNANGTVPSSSSSSNCLKLYCECFAAGFYCKEDKCGCSKVSSNMIGQNRCQNNAAFENKPMRDTAIEQALASTGNSSVDPHGSDGTEQVASFRRSTPPSKEIPAQAVAKPLQIDGDSVSGIMYSMKQQVEEILTPSLSLTAIGRKATEKESEGVATKVDQSGKLEDKRVTSSTNVNVSATGSSGHMAQPSAVSNSSLSAAERADEDQGIVGVLPQPRVIPVAQTELVHKWEVEINDQKHFFAAMHKRIVEMENEEDGACSKPAHDLMIEDEGKVEQLSSMETYASKVLESLEIDLSRVKKLTDAAEVDIKTRMHEKKQIAWWTTATANNAGKKRKREKRQLQQEKEKAKKKEDYAMNTPTRSRRNCNSISVGSGSKSDENESFQMLENRVESSIDLFHSLEDMPPRKRSLNMRDDFIAKNSGSSQAPDIVAGNATTRETITFLACDAALLRETANILRRKARELCEIRTRLSK